jgi:N,N'-diacetyllegionaminate synthase
MRLEIIAEIGVNHNGNLDAARRLIDAAKEAGADIAKFQLWDSDKVYPEDRRAKMKALELNVNAIMKCRDYCDHADIDFLCTPDTLDDAKFLGDIGCKRIKIGSSNVTNIELIKGICQLGFGEIIISTGACSWEEMDRAMVYACGQNELTVMHCVSSYPAPSDQLNLNVIGLIPLWARKGFSDHTRGYQAALVALGIGATVFEKHITLDHGQSGPDHEMSLEPDFFSYYVRMLREGAEMLGDGVKIIQPCERTNRVEYDRFVKAQYANSSAV